MSALAAAAAATGLFLIAAGPGREPLVRRVPKYLGIVEEPAGRPGISRLELAGLAWSRPESVVNGAAAAVAGAVCGVLAAQGDLLVAGGSSPVGLALVGAVAGLLLLRIWITNRIESRDRQLQQEIPIAADMLSLSLRGGDSVLTALGRLRDQTRGVSHDLLGRVLQTFESGGSLTESLIAESRSSRHPGTARLLDLLARGHRTGGGLADDLAELASDLRAELSRQLAAESGKRSLTVYGPILVLVVPVTLAFLLFPAISSLQLFAA